VLVNPTQKPFKPNVNNPRSMTHFAHTSPFVGEFRQVHCSYSFRCVQGLYGSLTRAEAYCCSLEHWSMESIKWSMMRPYDRQVHLGETSSIYRRNKINLIKLPSVEILKHIVDTFGTKICALFPTGAIKPQAFMHGDSSYLSLCVVVQ